eukprot:CAMPEP_0206221702 /NCGR_PEP_ID=MMETSP0047_2-20121206/5559_1 /ASSEMBLY_ACC=CAM_ASM_000192 /TAXON_ID=195065 /ORGANISM="Chroomonas mesostigmatica_cf, Strain CCMP1168" /LENGTH=409 /DNA_ID=CAMNT_0053644461 /DNA_START=87 /DNA_END=1313 /DNA_ORIENTATION=+
MAKPKPTKAELANCLVKCYGIPAPKAIGSWADAASCERPSAASGLLPVADVVAACSPEQLGSVHQAALPLILSGTNVDATTMDRQGMLLCSALAAVTAVNPSDPSTQVIVFAHIPHFIDSIRKEIERLSAAAKATITCGSLSAGGSEQVLLGLAGEVGSAKSAPRLVVVAEVDGICRSGDRDAAEIAVLIKGGGASTQAVLLSGEMLGEGAETDPGARRIRDFQGKAVGRDKFATVEDGRDLSEFVVKHRLPLDYCKVSSLGVKDLQSLKTCDPQALHAAVGQAMGITIAGALEMHERSLMSAGGFQVPPFDIASGQWEWTPDSVEKWEEKGLDRIYFHTEPDGSNWVFGSASQSAMAKGQVQAAPWDLNPNLTPDGDDYSDSQTPQGLDDDEADAAWAEMFGSAGSPG